MRPIAIFGYQPGQQPQVFDQPDAVLPVPPFATDLILSTGIIFVWLRE